MPTTSVRIEKKLERRLQKLAKATGRTKTWYIRQALESYLDQEEWLIEEIERGVEAANEGRFASNEDVRAAFLKWGVDIDA